MILPINKNRTIPPCVQLDEIKFSAIKGDASIPEGVRAEVLHLLENEKNQKAVYIDICNGETFGGNELHPTSTKLVGHAKTRGSFIKGITTGYFGSPRRDSRRGKRSRVEQEVDEMEFAPDKLVALRKLLPNSDSSLVDPRYVCWYFLSQGDKCLPELSPDLALRLALPSAGEFTGESDYIVFEFSIGSFGMGKNLQKPRFVDVDFKTLSLWRYGGSTVPWVNNLTGLIEAVSLGVPIALEATNVSFIKCKHVKR